MLPTPPQLSAEDQLPLLVVLLEQNAEGAMGDHVLRDPGQPIPNIIVFDHPDVSPERFARAANFLNSIIEREGDTPTGARAVIPVPDDAPSPDAMMGFAERATRVLLRQPVTEVSGIGRAQVTTIHVLSTAGRERLRRGAQ